MSPASNTLLALILIALGFIGLTLGFLVPDKKKSTLSLVLAVVIIVTGVFQWGFQSIVRYQVSRRMRQLQQQSQMDLDAMRQKLKEQAQAAPATAPKKP